MTARRIIVPGAMPSRDANGRALPAKLRFYEPGTSRNELKAVYTDDTLSIEHEQPIPSNASGYFVQIWADDAETFDYGLTDQTFDRLLRAETGISPADDAVLASGQLAEASAISAEESEDTAVAAQITASAAEVTASAAAITASDAADRAVLAAGFDPDDYVQVAAQTLTTPQKLQARTNIGAADGGVTRSVRTSNTILAYADIGTYVDVTSGTFTQTVTAAATLGDSWFADYGNSGTGIVTIDPNASETIGGASTLTVNSGEVYRVISDGTNLQIIALKTDLGPHVIIQDQKASGTDAGAKASGGYSVRTLNTVVRNIAGASLNSNQVTLPAGKWKIGGYVSYGNDNVPRVTRAQIYNVTDSQVAALGPGHEAVAVDGGFSHIPPQVITITSAKVFELRHHLPANAGTNTLGYASSTSDVEIYAEFRATRII